MLRLTEGIRQYWLGLKYSFRSLAEYRASFLAHFMSSIGWVMAIILLWYSIFQNVKTINGWSFTGSMLMLGYMEFGIVLWDILSTYFVPDMIVHGELDNYLARPISLIPFLFGRFADLGGLSELVTAGIYLSLALTGVNILWFLVGLVYAILGTSVLIVIEMSIVGLSFWMGRVRKVLDAFYNLIMPQQFYPVVIYPLFWRFMFTVLFPIGLMQSVPAQVALDPATLPRNLALLVPVLVAWVLIARIVWREGLKRYESAGG